MLAWLYVLLLFILLPLRLLIAVVIQVSYFPSFSRRAYYLPASYCFDDFSKIIRDIEGGSRLNEDIAKIRDGGDGAKFMGLLDFVTGESHIQQFISEEGLKRYPKIEDCRQEATVSGDMMAGFVLGICSSKNKNKYFDKHVHNTIFKGYPFKVEHPFGEKHSVGHMLNLWSDGGDVIKTLSMIDCAIVCAKENGNGYFSLVAMKYALIITNFPLLLFSYDAAFFLGRLYYMPWYVQHTRMMYYVAGYYMTKAWYYRRAMESLVKRYGMHNADINLLYQYVMQIKHGCAGVERAVKILGDDRLMPHLLLTEYIKHGKATKKYECESGTARYISLKDLIRLRFVTKPMADAALAPCFLSEEYIWERSPIKFKEPAPRTRLDLYIPLKMVEYLGKEK